MIEKLSGPVTAGPQEAAGTLLAGFHLEALASGLSHQLPEPLVPEQVHIFQYRDRISILLGGHPRPWLGRHGCKPVRCGKSI